MSTEPEMGPHPTLRSIAAERSVRSNLTAVVTHMEVPPVHGGPSIVDLEDVPWMDVSKIRLSDGRVVGIREKWIELSPRYVVFFNVWDPGAITPPHGHT